MEGPDRNKLSLLFCSLGAIFFGWLVLFPLRKLPFLGSFSILLGKNPIVHILLVFILFLYLHLFITKPDLAKRSALNSVSTTKDLIVYVLAALFVAGAAINFYPASDLAAVLGEQAGIIAVFAGVAIGGILPACPFISYPIIGGLYAAGAGFLGVMGMLFGSGLGFVCVITADLSFFDSRILALRVFLTFLAALLAGLLVYALMYVV